MRWPWKKKLSEQRTPKARPSVRFTGNVEAKGDFFMDGDIRFLVGGNFSAESITTSKGSSLLVTGITSVGKRSTPPYTRFSVKPGEYIGVDPPVETIYIRDWLDEIIYEHPGPFAIEKPDYLAKHWSARE